MSDPSASFNGNHPENNLAKFGYMYTRYEGFLIFF
jgi:hypothetical protein